MQKFLTSVKALWNYLVGSPKKFPLENRIFNTLCIITLVAAVYNIPFNLFVGLPVSAFISVVLTVVLAYLFYLARFKNKLQLSFVIASLLINSLFAVNYFYNSGIVGPTIILFVISFFLIIAVAPQKQYPVWISLNLGLVLLLLFIEYFYPARIINSYQDRQSLFTDVASAYIVVIVLIYTGTNYIRKNYNAERKAVEEKALALEQLNSEKNKLFSIISHDLRAPLASVQYYLELLNKVNIPPEKRAELEALLLHTTRNTQDMLFNLLSWSRTQMEGANVNLCHTNLKQALEKTLTVHQSIAQNKNISFQYNLENSANVVADPDLLQLIVRNLISNAIKFTPRDGAIQINTTVKEEECLLVIKDNGKGIPEEQQSKIFSLNAHSTYGTNNEKGVGLGLILCKEFTEALSGKIWFESQPGAGTIFYLSLPLA